MIGAMTSRYMLLLTLPLVCSLWAAAPHADVVVFAPHPDDETLGCAGILAQAVAQRKTAKVVLMTGGDAFPAMASLIAKKPVAGLGRDDFMALSRFRQNQARLAITALGLKAEDLILLGYPDSALERLYKFEGTIAFRQEFTQQRETYGLIQPDYHTATHGAAAPYTRTAVLADVVEILRTFQPHQIYVTDAADSHADHSASFRFVQEAAKEVNYRGEFYTYLNHGGEEWPWPKGITPERPFAAHKVKGRTIPLGVVWPPPRRVPLTREQAELKLRAIRAHSSHLAGATDPGMIEERAYLESFVKAEEVFWITHGEGVSQ
jgi:LmbE family N-acetylglucosaminyl deacetylase